MGILIAIGLKIILVIGIFRMREYIDNYLGLSIAYGVALTGMKSMALFGAGEEFMAMVIALGFMFLLDTALMFGVLKIIDRFGDTFGKILIIQTIGGVILILF